MNRYKEYTSTAFLEDEFFKKSVLHPTIESDIFWNKLIDENLLNVEEYESAKLILKQLTMLGPIVENDEQRSLQLWNRLQVSTKDYYRKKVIRRYIYIASSVACVLVAILLYTKLPISQENVLRQLAGVNSPISGETSSNIQLFLAEEKIDLEGNSAIIDYNLVDSVKINEKQLEKDKATYNQLLVPYGKRSFLILEDGSRIWVNAGSHVIYPTKFSNSKRIIFVKGEIYADIAKDSKRPFQIVSDRLNVEVLGTSLNISDYQSDESSSVVLVEGSVMVKSNASNKQSYILKPSEMLVYANHHSKVEFVDVSNYVAWKDGLYHFKNKSLGEVLKVVERYYNVDIECTEEVFAIRCTGSLDLKDDVSQVIKGVSYAASVESKREDNIFKFY